MTQGHRRNYTTLTDATFKSKAAVRKPGSTTNLDYFRRFGLGGRLALGVPTVPVDDT